MIKPNEQNITQILEQILANQKKQKESIDLIITRLEKIEERLDKLEKKVDLNQIVMKKYVDNEIKKLLNSYK